MNQYDPTFDLKINVGHCDLYLMSSDFALYIEDYSMYDIIIWDYDFDHKIIVGHCDIYFMGQ